MYMYIYPQIAHTLASENPHCILKSQSLKPKLQAGDFVTGLVVREVDLAAPRPGEGGVGVIFRCLTYSALVDLGFRL